MLYCSKLGLQMRAGASPDFCESFTEEQKLSRARHYSENDKNNQKKLIKRFKACSCRYRLAALTTLTPYHQPRPRPSQSASRQRKSADCQVPFKVTNLTNRWSHWIGGIKGKHVCQSKMVLHAIYDLECFNTYSARVARIIYNISTFTSPNRDRQSFAILLQNKYFISYGCFLLVGLK